MDKRRKTLTCSTYVATATTHKKYPMCIERDEIDPDMNKEIWIKEVVIGKTSLGYSDWIAAAKGNIGDSTINPHTLSINLYFLLSMLKNYPEDTWKEKLKYLLETEYCLELIIKKLLSQEIERVPNPFPAQ